MDPVVEVLRVSEEDNGEQSASYLINGHFKEHNILSANPAFWKSLFEMPLNEEDTFLITYPRAGTTLTQTILLSLLGKDFTPSQIFENSPFIEWILKNYNGVEAAAKLTPPRLLKTHVTKALMPLEFEKKKPKSVIIVRNYFDCFISNYNFYLTNPNLARLYKNITFEEFFDNFVEKETHEAGSFFEWHASWLKYATSEGSDHCIVINYKDIVEDKVNTTKKIAEFLGISFQEETVMKAVRDSDFKKMQDSYDKFGFNNFIREGKVNTGISQFSEEQRQRFEEKVKQTLGTHVNLIKM